MRNPTPTQILVKAKELIETHGWIQGFYGTEDCGFCIYGALGTAAGEIVPGQRPGAEAALRLLGYELTGDRLRNVSPITWNDEPGRTREEVLSLFDTVIAKAG